ncbi:GcrA family cell cycle regulator [Sinorhizobium americanum]|uniref:Uncharacterized protein n=1 Tax=Sinorhizobium americanum TaxID=194963 RepID=A0A1L3LLZ9_9HYPH|nr:GcrA family cell cycle regulator [Sinorhizobium americanum]APG91132.1 hypothetical protein SAMCFNEI73_Ch1842 [Sinorhizobium americanum]OAP43710.1 GcrA cell cycle regulator [Sinorhizobium americanum]
MTTHDPAFIEAAAKLWRDGLSASKIAKALGGSRNVFVGIAYRNRDLFPKRTKRKLQVRAPAPRVRKSLQLPAPASASAAIEVGISAMADGAERLPTSKQLHELKAGQCCWPINNGGPYLFCAAETTGRYCSNHAARSLKKNEVQE